MISPGRYPRSAVLALLLITLLVASCKKGEDNFTIAPPGTVRAEAGEGEITVTFSQVVGAVSYNLYWSTSSGFTKDTATKIAGVTSPYIHIGLINGQAYYYAVTAENLDGEGKLSVEVSATPQTYPPATPANVTVISGDATATLGWDASPNATGYNIYWSTTSGLTAGDRIIISDAVSPHVHGGLRNGTTYYYIVTAYNSGGSSAESVEVSATPSLAAPGVPANLAVTAGNENNVISWDAVPAAESYNLYWSATTGLTPSDGTLISGAASPYTHYSLTGGNAYYYIVTAVKAGLESGASAEAGATPLPAIPPTPVNVQAFPNFGMTGVVWDAAAGADSYNVYWSTSAGVTTASGSKIGNITDLLYIHSGLTNYTTYYYIVTAENTGGESSRSTEVLVTPPPFTGFNQDFISSNPITAGNFGSSISVHDELAIVGAPHEDSSPSDTGTAYVYNFNWSTRDWGLDVQLAPSVLSTGDAFGGSVAVHDNTALIGSSMSAGANGTVWFFQRDPDANSWDAGTQLSATSPVSSEEFGFSVSVFGALAAIGAPYNSNGGQVYIFSQDSGGNWGQIAILTPTGLAAGDAFGYSVSISDNAVLVGAPYDDIGADTNAGQAFLFNYDPDNTSWGGSIALNPTERNANDNYGYSVSLETDMSEGLALIGAPFADPTINGTTKTDAGSAHMFSYDAANDSWDEQPLMTAFDGNTSDRFGNAVSVMEDAALIGAIFADPDPSDGVVTDAGAAYLFHASWVDGSWITGEMLHAQSPGAYDEFGGAVDISWEGVFMGAPNTETPATDAGKITIFE